MLVLQHEGDLHIDLVARDVAVLDHDVHILHPATLHASKRLGSTGDGLVDGVLEALLRDGAKFCDSRNAHTFVPPLTVARYLSNGRPQRLLRQIPGGTLLVLGCTLWQVVVPYVPGYSSSGWNVVLFEGEIERPVPTGVYPPRHFLLVYAVLASDLRRLLVARFVRQALQELVGGYLHMLCGVAVTGVLASLVAPGHVPHALKERGTHRLGL